MFPIKKPMPPMPPVMPMPGAPAAPPQPMPPQPDPNMVVNQTPMPDFASMAPKAKAPEKRGHMKDAHHAHGRHKKPRGEHMD